MKVLSQSEGGRVAGRYRNRRRCRRGASPHGLAENDAVRRRLDTPAAKRAPCRKPPWRPHSMPPRTMAPAELVCHCGADGARRCPIGSLQTAAIPGGAVASVCLIFSPKQAHQCQREAGHSFSVACQPDCSGSSEHFVRRRVWSTSISSVLPNKSVEEAGGALTHSECVRPHECRQNQGVKHHVECIEHPTETSGDECLSLRRRRVFPPERRSSDLCGGDNCHISAGPRNGSRSYSCCQ